MVDDEPGLAWLGLLVRVEWEVRMRVGIERGEEQVLREVVSPN